MAHRLANTYTIYLLAMRLQTQLIVLFCLLFSLIFSVQQYLNYQRIQQTITENLLFTAERMRNTLMATRRIYHHQFINSQVELNDKTLGFLPAYAMNRISEDLANWDNSGVSFNNVSDQPRNPNQLADEIELKAMAFFRENPNQEVQFIPFQDKQNQPYYLYARPIWVEQYCLQCHGEKEKAPKTIRERYDTAYNYKLGDLRGIMSIKMPAKQLSERVMSSFYQSFSIHFIILLLLIALTITLIKRFISCPMEKLEKAMKSVSKGENFQEITGLKGEFATIGDNFNTMTAQIKQQQLELKNTHEQIQHQLEKQVAQRTQELENSYQELQNFAYIVSHDLRSPLVSIQGFSGELRYDIDLILSQQDKMLNNIPKEYQQELELALKERIPESVEFIESSVKKMDGLIKAILKLSRLGRRQLEPEMLSVKEIINNNIEALAWSFENKKIDCQVDEMPDLCSDRLSLEQVFGNLLSNALKYIPSDRAGKIHIWSQPVEQGWEFHIKDNGRGIDYDDLDRIFEIFRRVGEQDQQGEGMGLTYVRSILHSLNGKIWCQSELGKGTTFSFMIPEIKK